MHISDIFRHMGGDGVDYSGLRQLGRQGRVRLAEKQYNPKLHTVNDKGLRPDKPIRVPNGQKDPVTGDDIYELDFSKVSRVPVAFEKYIIDQKATFAAGSGIKLKPSKEGVPVYDYVSRNWFDNKTDFRLQDIFRQVMAYTEAAVIFFGERGAETFDEFKYNMKVVSPETGDILEPFFDEDVNLIAFGREYKVDDRTRYDFYIVGQSGFVEIYKFEDGKPFLYGKGNDISDIAESESSYIVVTKYRKLPIIYWSQDEPECNITSEMIEEYEWALSDFLTQMGYSADPILFGRGTTLKLPPKGSAGKYIEGSADASLEFVTPANATESRDLQFRLLQKFIFGLNRAVFLDMETMKELGDVSGAALDRYLIDAYMQATGKQQGYLGIGVQRMANWLLSAWSDLVGAPSGYRIYVEFNRYSVTSESDQVELAMKANGGKPVVTHKTSISMAGIEEDTEKAYDEIEEESSQPVVSG